MVIWFLFFIPWTWDIALVDFRWLCSSDKTLLVVHVPFYASPDLSRWYFVCSWGMLVCGIRVKRLLPWRGRSPSWPWDWYYFLLKCNSLGNQYAFFFLNGFGRSCWGSDLTDSPPWAAVGQLRGQPAQGAIDVNIFNHLFPLRQAFNSP